MRQTAIHASPIGPAGTGIVVPGGELQSWGRRFASQVLRMLDVARERRQLASLDDRLLKDIGLSRSLAAREADRSVFDLPVQRVSGRL